MTARLYAVLDCDVAESCTAFACVWSANFCRLTRLVGKVQQKLEMLQCRSLERRQLGSIVLE